MTSTAVSTDSSIGVAQIEQHAEIRAAMPTPKQGELPLPKGLPEAMLQCNPQAVEDLNAIVPQGSQPLSSKELNEHVSFTHSLICICRFDTHALFERVCSPFWLHHVLEGLPLGLLLTEHS